LTVGFAPAFTAQPISLAILSGGNAVFNATASGSTPLAFQWSKNGTNLLNGGNIFGATSNVLTFTAVTATNAGDYTLVATNIYGSATSSVATLNVLVPPALTVPLTNQTIQCGGNAAFSVTGTGTAPLSYQWSLGGAAIADATNTSLSLTNVHVPIQLVAVIVTNLYGSATSSVTLAVQDTLAPVVTLNSINPFNAELGGAFVDPGATAYDLCAGTVPVVVSGAVNTNAVSTNIITYTASDSNGNTGTATRTVIVRDTTPPTILWSFTNVMLAAGTNCSVTMPDVTGTNFIMATDLSGALTILQTPANNAALPLGTNVVVITVADASGNVSRSTNAMIVQDQTPPVILIQPQSQTNTIGTTASFSVGAQACTPLEFKWYFNNVALTTQTNSTLTLSNLNTSAAGNCFVVASAGGGSTTSSVVTLTVNLVSPVIAMISSANPSGFKNRVIFTASIAPTNATGSIQFLTNGAAFDVEPLVAGTAVSTNLSSLPRGTNVVTAIYSGDVDDLPATNTLVQIVTNHPPAAADVFYSRQAGYPLDIAVADLATNWSDADGDTVSLASIGISTDGVTVTNNAGTLVYFGTNNVDDQFVCTVSDGWGGTNFQTVFIEIVLTNMIPNIISVVNGPNGSVTLSLGGAPGDTYVLETTTNLLPPATWLPMATNTLGTNGVWQFTDTDAAIFPQRFYRLKLGP
jgi:hypothetical protein